MELTRVAPPGRQLIQKYTSGGFKVSDVAYSGSIIVTPRTTILWPITRLDDISAESFGELKALEPNLDICLLGCGARMQRLPPALRAELKQQGLSPEPMDTGAASRTYNMLVAEGRMVAAALIAL